MRPKDSELITKSRDGRGFGEGVRGGDLSSNYKGREILGLVTQKP